MTDRTGGRPRITLPGPPTLARADVDRAGELRGDEAALAAGWATARVLDVDPAGRFAVADAGGRPVLEFAAGPDVADAPPADAVFLGRLPGGAHAWARRIPDRDGGDRPAGSLRSHAETLSDDEAALAVEAVAVLGWHDYCVTRAGGPVRYSAAGWEDADAAPGGGRFPRTDPAVICLVHDGGRRVLLARGTRFPGAWFSVLAGFVEPGESLEQCVRREVAEEVGLEVDGVTYLGSQPWPFPRSLMVAFEAVADPERPLELDPAEIADARWFDVDDVARALAGEHETLEIPRAVSIAHAMIAGWVAAVRG